MDRIVHGVAKILSWLSEKIDRYKYSDKIIGIRYAYWFNLAKLFFNFRKVKLKLKNYKFQINASLCKKKGKNKNY